MATTNSISRTVRICRWQARVNSLWLWVYCLMTLTLHAYLLYRAVIRCKEYNELPWRTNDKPVVELYVYICLVVLSVMCIPFFIITSIFKVGNYASDGVRLGRDNIHEHELADALRATSTVTPLNDSDEIQVEPTSVEDEVTSRGSTRKRLQTLWRHVGPFSHGFHLLSAFALLLPSMLLEAQEIRYGFRNPEAAWHTDLDFLFGRRQHFTETDSPRAINHEGDSSSSDTTPSSSAADTSIIKAPTPTVSPEYINYIVALVMYSIRYAGVFWYTKMSFSLLFLVQMIVITLHFGFSFCGVGILYKFQHNMKGFPDLNLALPAPAILVLYLAANLFLSLSSLAVFNYGFQHYKVKWCQFLHKYAAIYAKHKGHRGGCHGYTGHIMATIFLLMVVCCRGPIVYDYVVFYRKTGFSIILACIVVDAVYMVFWIALWFSLTLKQNWAFRIMYARYSMPVLDRKEGLNQSAKSVRGTSEVNSQNRDVADGLSNGHAVTDTVTTDQQNKSLNAGGMLRKSKDKRTPRAQKVQFDESPDSGVVGCTSEPTEQDTKKQNNVDTPQSKEKDKHKNGNAKKKESVKKGPFRRTNSDPAASRKKKLNHSGTDSTPENTMTRNYRYSIRDKCGQYYRVMREITPSPDAQSSPLPSEQTQPLTKNPEEILLSAMPQEGVYSAECYVDDQQASSSKNLSYFHGKPTDISLHYRSPDGSCVPLRQPAAHNRDGSFTKPQDMRYSYPLVYPPHNRVQEEYYPPGHLPWLTVFDPQSSQLHSPARHSMHLDGMFYPPHNMYNGHDGSYLVHNDRGHPHISERGENSTQDDGDRVEAPPRPPRTAFDPSRPPREIRVVGKKLDRDSALPSSNETSSNDSNDVLCSQV